MHRTETDICGAESLQRSKAAVCKRNQVICDPKHCGRCCRSVLWTMASSDQGDVMLMLGGGLVANAIQMQASLLLQVNSVDVLFQMQSVGLSLYLNLLCSHCCWSTKQIQSCGSV